MNWLDVVLLALLGFSVIAGVMKGLVREIFSLGGVILAILLGLMFAPTLQPTFDRWIPVASAAYAAGFLCVFVVVMILVEIVARFVQKLVKLVRLTLMNRVLGGAFGLLRGILIATIVILGVTLFAEPGDSLLAGSKVTPVLTKSATLFAPLLPDEVEQGLRDQIDALEIARTGRQVDV